MLSDPSSRFRRPARCASGYPEWLSLEILSRDGIDLSGYAAESGGDGAHAASGISLASETPEWTSLWDRGPEWSRVELYGVPPLGVDLKQRMRDVPADGYDTTEAPLLSALDLDDSVVRSLLFKQVVTMSDVERAWQTLEGNSESPGALWRTLAADPRLERGRGRMLAEAASVAGIPRIDVDPEVARTVMEEHIGSFSRHDWQRLLDLRVFPVGRRAEPAAESDGLIFASHDPTRPEVARLLRQLQVESYELGFVHETVLEEILNKVVADPARLDVDGLSFTGPATDEGAHLVSTAVERCLRDAASSGATAVHVRNADGSVRIDFREDGDLRPWVDAEDIDGADLFETLSRMADGEIPQGRASLLRIEEDGCRYRFTYARSANRRDIVVRVIRDDSFVLTELGLPADVMNAVETALAGPGLLLVAGPPQSGKSTTVRAIERRFTDRSAVVVRLEDVLQEVGENGRAARTAEEILEIVTALDPDLVVSTRPIRSRWEAEAAVALASEGHLVAAAMCAVDGAAAAARLHAMGLPPLLLARGISAVVSQRLLRRLCSACRVGERRIDGALLQRAGFSRSDIAEAAFSKASATAHCQSCGGSGYDGYHLAAGVTVFSDVLKRHVALSDDLDEAELRLLALREGALSAAAHVRRASADGIISIEELMRAAASER